jgi:hypothetical protein
MRLALVQQRAVPEKADNISKPRRAWFKTS